MFNTRRDVSSEKRQGEKSQIEWPALWEAGMSLEPIKMDKLGNSFNSFCFAMAGKARSFSSVMLKKKKLLLGKGALYKIACILCFRETTTKQTDYIYFANCECWNWVHRIEEKMLKFFLTLKRPVCCFLFVCFFWNTLLKNWMSHFLCDLVVKNLPCNAEDAGSTPGQGNKTSHADYWALTL